MNTGWMTKHIVTMSYHEGVIGRNFDNIRNWKGINPLLTGAQVQPTKPVHRETRTARDPDMSREHSDF